MRLNPNPAHNRSPFRRVSRDNPCPVCGKHDWCVLIDDGAVVLCMRVALGAFCEGRDGGWLHRLRESSRLPRRPGRYSFTIDDGRPRRDDLPVRAKGYATNDPQRVKEEAESLGVHPLQLRRLGVGWSKLKEATTWPMCDGYGEIVGIRFRRREGKKFAEKGSRNGLFLPTDLTGRGPLLLPEGATDTAAALALGFEAAGRPDCLGGVRYVVELVRRLATDEAVVIADDDEGGLRGAARLASELQLYVPTVLIVVPPMGKDLRESLALGLTREDLLAHIRLTPPKSLGGAA